MSTATKKRTKENAAHCGFDFLLTASALIGTVSTGLPALTKLTLPSMAMCSGALTDNRKAAKGEGKAPFFQASVFTSPFQSARCCEWQSGAIAPDGRLSDAGAGMRPVSRPRLVLAATDQATVGARFFRLFLVASQKRDLRISCETKKRCALKNARNMYQQFFLLSPFGGWRKLIRPTNLVCIPTQSM